MEHILIRLLGFLGTIIAGDAAVYDRWVWLKKNIHRGPIRTLDAGCGSGALTLYAARVGDSAIGISFDERNNEKGRQRSTLLGINNCRFITENFNNLEQHTASLGTFDQIICFETIEHIINDVGLLKIFYSYLNKNGRLLLTAPYRFYNHLPGDYISEVEDGAHVRWGYTHDEINKLLLACNFTVIKQEYVTGFISQQLIRLNRIISNFDFRLAWLVVLPLRPLTIFDPLVTKWLKYPYLSVAVVAEKR